MSMLSNVWITSRSLLWSPLLPRIAWQSGSPPGHLLRMHGRQWASGPQQQRGFSPDNKKDLTFFIPSKELPKGIPEGGQQEMYEPWIWGCGSPAQGASHSPGTLVTMGTTDSALREIESGRGSQESVPIQESLMDLEMLWDPDFHTPLGTPHPLILLYFPHPFTL